MNFNGIAYVARTKLVASDVIVSLGHVHQLVAAALGYNSLAALQASSEENPGIPGALYMILDHDCITSRATSLELGGYTGKIINAIIAGIESQNSAPRVFRNIEDFFEDVLSGFINEEIFHDEAINTASAETNAYFSDSFAELVGDPEPLRDAVSTWEVPVSGVVNMDQDPDRMFFGDKIQFGGVIRMKKAGRVCLAASMELDISATVAHDYYDRPDDADIEEVVS